MRNILLLQLETKISLTILIIVVAIFLVTIFKSIDNFNEFINQINPGKDYEEIRLQESP